MCTPLGLRPGLSFSFSGSCHTRAQEHSARGHYIIFWYLPKPPVKPDGFKGSMTAFFDRFSQRQPPNICCQMPGANHIHQKDIDSSGLEDFLS